MLALGEAIPVEIVNPRYPRKAAIDRVGGYVRFVFDISPQGAVENLRTIESVPEGVFDSVARYAITRWRFKPAEKNGESVRQTDMAYTMEFKIGE